MKFLFDYIPLILFFIVYRWQGIYAATSVLMLGYTLQIALLKLLGRPVTKTQWILCAAVLLFGGMTLLFRDDLFIKWKVSIVNWLFAFILLISQWIFKKNLIQQMLGKEIKLPERIWQRLNVAWAGFFASLGAVNLYIAYHFDQATWVNFKVFGVLGLTFIFAIGTAVYLAKHVKS